MSKDILEIRGYGNMSTYGYIKHDELSGYAIAHHGIKGQKWGVRRYQNPDGSLTPDGLRRYGHMLENKNDSSKTRAVKADWMKMDDNQFRSKYRVSKEEYSKRVKRYGDPYLNSPMAKYAKRKSDARSKYKTYMKMQNELNDLHKQIIANPRNVDPKVAEKYNLLVNQNGTYLRQNYRDIRYGKRIDHNTNIALKYANKLRK